MSDVPHVLWNFLPGQHEADSFAYLNDVRLTLREMRLAGVRSITPIPAAGVVLAQWDSVITTYSIPLTASTGAVLRACATSWLQVEGGRSLRLKADHAEVDAHAASDVDRFFDDALIGVVGWPDTLDERA